MAHLINYFFESTREFKRALPKKDWIKSCLKNEKKGLDCINFIFCSDRYLQKINKKHLNKSYLTDVITFDNKLNINDKDIIGDIFISIDRVRDNHYVYKTEFCDELARIMIHGTLHLIGYSDKIKGDKKIMTEKENFYLKLK